MALAFEVHYTVADYEQWKGDWELIEGIPVSMSPSPTLTHQGISGKIFSQLDASLGDCSQCLVVQEVDWRVADDTVLRPDCIVVCNEDHDFVYKAPELIIEILSPSTSFRDEHYKFELYEQEGVKYYIIVNPDSLIAKVFQLKQGKYQKVGDFSTEIVYFDIQNCQASIDFNHVFSKFRK